MTIYTQWSVDSIPDFWSAIWEFGEVKASKKWDQVVDDLKSFRVRDGFLEQN